MKHVLRILSLLAVMALLATCAAAETAEEDELIATVNGEALMASEYIPIENSYLSFYESGGLDLTDEANAAYVKDIALTAAIEQMLVEQDKQAQGCYAFDEETGAWLTEQGVQAYQQALANVGEALRAELALDEDADVTVYALAYADVLGVTEQNYIDVYRSEYATINYYDWLIADNPVTDADVQAVYEQNVETSRALYADDVAAFENAVCAGADVWYLPEGYRSVLQILLPAQGETDEEKLASVQDTVDEIYARLEAGESFASLIEQYGTDATFEAEGFYESGYQVHRESIMWEDAFVNAAFSEQMAQPGDVSAPFASTLGVHILYYLEDLAAGPVELTQEISDALSYAIYTERTQARLSERIDELADSAEVVFP